MVAARNIVLLLKRGDSKKAKELKREFCLDHKKITALLQSAKAKAEQPLKEENELVDESVESAAPEGSAAPAARLEPSSAGY